MASTNQYNAAFDAAHDMLLDELRRADFFMKDLVVQKFESQQGRNMLLRTVIAAVDAALKAAPKPA